MGTTRTLIFYGLIFPLLGASVSHAQMPQRLTGQSAQQAYYQPLTQNQYQRYAQATYDDRFATPPRHHVTPSIQQRASRLLQSQQTEDQLDQELNQFLAAPIPAGDRTKNIGSGPMQQNDPIGQKQNQDPFGEDQVKKVPQEQNQDPFGEDQVKKVPPEIDKQIDPFADPPADDPKVQPPLTKPKDEQDKTQQPPENPFKDPEPKRDPMPQDDTQPKEKPEPGAIEPKDLIKPKDQTQPPFGQQPRFEERARQSSDGSMVYHPGPPLKEAYTPPAKAYLPPPAVNQPPIVRSDQYLRYQMPQQICQPQLTQQPLFKPDYQPIPGLPAQPQYVVPREGPVPPGVFVPPITEMEFEVAPSNQSRIVANPPYNVYSDVVVDPGTTGCVRSATGSQPCGSHCQSCVSNCQPCVSNCQTYGNGCSNFYVSVFGGYTDLRDLAGRSGNRQMNADSGGGVGVALGRRNGRNLRTEAEFSYRHNNLSGFVTSPVPANPPVDGGLNAFAGMANAYWEIIDVPSRCFKPYVGAGIGFVSIDAEIRNSVVRNIVPAGVQNDSSFAYQWIAGVNYKAYRNMDLFAEYRFFKADTFSLDPSIPGLGDRYTFATDNVFLGLRWKF